MRLLPIAKPCAESFAGMVGDEKKRFCATCDKHVHNLSAHTEDEARAIFREARGARVCVRFARDASGAVRFAATLAVATSLASCSSAAPVTALPETPAEVDHDMGDSIPDEVDRCPDTPSPNDDDGCPPVTPDAGKD